MDGRIASLRIAAATPARCSSRPPRCCASRCAIGWCCRASRSGRDRFCLHFRRLRGSATGSGFGAVRREAFWSRAVVRDHRGGPVAAGSCKLRAACPAGTGGDGRQAALTTTGRVSTVRWPGSGKQRKGEHKKPASERSSRRSTSSNLAEVGWAAARTHAIGVGELLGRLYVAGREATEKVCGVSVARLQGHSWSPHPSSGSRMNAGTLLAVPSPAGMTPGGGKSRRRLMPPGGGGGLVVVAGATTGHGGRESRLQGEGVQQVRSRHLRRGGRW